MSPRQPTWTDVKAKLADIDSKGLVDLVHGLYGAHKDNKTYLHSRFGLGEDVLEPYKTTIERWLRPDVYRNQKPSVAKAKQAIVNYKKAVGDAAGMAELMVFFCEQSVRFCADFGFFDEDYLDALMRMFERALPVVITLPRVARDALFARLERAGDTARNFGYGVGDRMNYLLSKYAEDDSGEADK